MRVQVSKEWTQDERRAVRAVIQEQVNDLVSLMLCVNSAPAADLEMFRADLFEPYLDRRESETVPDLLDRRDPGRIETQRMTPLQELQAVTPQRARYERTQEGDA